MPTIEGITANNTAFKSNPVVVGGWDGTNAFALNVGAGGQIIVGGANGPALVQATAAVESAATAQHSLVVVPAGNWAMTSNPASGTLASAVQAAGGAGIRHVATSVSFGWSNDGTANTTARNLTVVLRDGAAGAGTIKMTWALRVPTTVDSLGTHITLSGLAVFGTAATAMTLEFNGTAADHTISYSNITGFDVS